MGWPSVGTSIVPAPQYLPLFFLSFFFFFFLPKKEVELVVLTGYQGGDKYQQSFYVFEELAQAPSTSSVRSLVSQAVAELHLGRTDEARSALEQALKKEPAFADAIANLAVLTLITGNDASELSK